MIYKIIFLVSLTFGITYLTGCIDEPDGRVRKKLEIILEDDMVAILEGIADTNLLDSTYYDMHLYKEFKGGKYSRKAEVDFYFLKNVNTKIVRKYRYHRDYKKWDRYYNKYQFSESK